ncbi:nuclear transport factor 2 family protein [Actinokineospora sp. HUAS TT18]|uniref:nuclear transport factor 2 family protein n=1 Tax=Actinokineospora sp. HUAS TT18 TaxID=3447451 RepID=UPI003F521EFA
MSATQDITQLVYRLGACLDDHRFDDLREVFTDDVTVSTPGGVAEGVVAVIEQAARNHAEYQGIQHLVGNVLVDVDGAEAAVRANLIGTFIKDGKRVLELGGVYRFGARKEDAGWRLSRLEVTPTWRI